MRYVVVASLCLLGSLLFGSAEARPKSRPMTFSTIEYQIFSRPGGQRFQPALSGKITKEADIKKLLAYFPQAGKRVAGKKPAGWEASIILSLKPKTGKSIVKVSVSHQFDLWSQGNGDFDLKAGFWETFRQIAKLRN